jgi:hypothetical protein
MKNRALHSLLKKNHPSEGLEYSSKNCKARLPSYVANLP